MESCYEVQDDDKSLISNNVEDVVRVKEGEVKALKLGSIWIMKLRRKLTLPMMLSMYILTM